MGGEQRDVLWSVTPDGATLIQVGDSCEVAFGLPREELLRNPQAWLGAVDEQDIPALQNALSMSLGGPQSVTYRLAGQAAGRWIHTVCRMAFDKGGKPLRIDCIARDVTTQRNASTTLENEFAKSREIIEREAAERQKLQEQLIHAQKMEGIGRLAGGIAHDFNNILTGILGYAELAMARLPEDLPVQEDLRQIQSAAERGANLTRQLLTFARKQVTQKKTLNLGEVAKGMEPLLSRMIGENVVLATVCEASLWNVAADPGQMEQVLMNLVINARDAMPNGGRIVVQISNICFESGFASFDLPLGDYVMLSVTDNGAGMDAATVARIFEPFFTTKEQGKGTGLGLSTCYGIVREAGGHIWVYSEPGQGTTFKVYLPRAIAQGEEASAASETPIADIDEKGVLLLVEDEPMVRTLSVQALALHGFEVLYASNGREALEVIAGHPGPIDLLITDVVMPEMGGRELAAAVVESRPEIKVLYTSGYAGDAIVQHGLLEAGSDFLQKPYSPTKLVAKVVEILTALRRAA